MGAAKGAQLKAAEATARSLRLALHVEGREAQQAVLLCRQSAKELAGMHAAFEAQIDAALDAGSSSSSSGGGGGGAAPSSAAVAAAMRTPAAGSVVVAAPAPEGAPSADDSSTMQQRIDAPPPSTPSPTGA